MNVVNILSYLELLKENNNRDWFHANKKEFNKVKKEFDGLVNEIIPGIVKFDSRIGMVTAKECVFRIYRDIRFSKDKTPFKTHFGAYIANGGRKSLDAAYYIHIDPAEAFLGGGLHMPPSDKLKLARKEIYYNIEEFKGLFEEKNFKKYYSGLIDYGDKLKKAPKDFPADFPDIDLLKHKSFLVTHKIPEKVLTGNSLVEYVVDAFKAMYPLNKFLNRAFEG